jgi:hypothetical protein
MKRLTGNFYGVDDVPGDYGRLEEQSWAVRCVALFLLLCTILSLFVLLAM